MKDTVTISKLAKLLNLHKSSISLALRDSPKVSEQTRRDVKSLAKKLDYRPNLLAKRLSDAKPSSVALVFPNEFQSLFSPVVVETLRHLTRLFAGRGIFLNILSSNLLEEADEAGFSSIPYTDGLLTWGDVPAQAAAKFGAKRPSLVLDPSHPSYSKYKGNALRIDNAGGAMAMARHLRKRGAKTLCFVGTPVGHLGFEERLEGARQGWLEAADKVSFKHRDLSELSDAFIKDFCKQPSPALFACNDWMAGEIWQRLIRLGIHVPKQMRLAGFDGEEFGKLFGLTTALFDSANLAQRAYENLYGLMTFERQAVNDKPIPVTLRLGRTT